VCRRGGSLRRPPLLFVGSKLRTVIYVDGFHFYYGALRKTPHKWLDLLAVFRATLQPENNIVCIKYFTARVSSTVADPDKANHQDAYLRALTHTTPGVRVYYGQFTTHENWARLVTPIGGNNYAKSSDLAQAICLVKRFHAQKIVGLLIYGKRGTSKELLAEVDFVRKIKNSAFAASQFPDPIPGTAITKPPDW
jgi:hypothetical protein